MSATSPILYRDEVLQLLSVVKEKTDKFTVDFALKKLRSYKSPLKIELALEFKKTFDQETFTKNIGTTLENFISEVGKEYFTVGSIGKKEDYASHCMDCGLIYSEPKEGENSNFNTNYVDLERLTGQRFIPKPLNPFLISTTICKPCDEVRNPDKYLLEN